MIFVVFMFFFFFHPKTAYEMRIIDWSSDVCSSDLVSPCVTTFSEVSSGLAKCDKLAKFGSSQSSIHICISDVTTIWKGSFGVRSAKLTTFAPTVRYIPVQKSYVNCL